MSFVRSAFALLLCAATVAVLGCSTPEADPSDAGGLDAGVESDAGTLETDAGVDAGPLDAGVDAGPLDAGIDAGVDAGPLDAGIDAGVLDAGTVDAGAADAGVDAGPSDAGIDAGSPDSGPPPLPDGGVCPMDGGAEPVESAQCRAIVESTGCNALQQQGALVPEIQVASDPPQAGGGWYPAGRFTLHSATLYTGPCGPSGPTGHQYSITLDVGGTASVDAYKLIQSEPGCPDLSWNFSGDTFGVGPLPYDHLNAVTWMCPTCANCSRTMKYSGTDAGGGPMDLNHGVFTIYLPQENGQTLLLEFIE